MIELACVCGGAGEIMILSTLVAGIGFAWRYLTGKGKTHERA